MTQDTRKPGSADQDKRPDIEKDHGKLETYDDALDEAVEETFPASDPISPAVAEKADRKQTEADEARRSNASRDPAGTQKK